MRQLELSRGELFSLTDAAPASIAWDYSFPECHLDDHPHVANKWVADGLFRTRFTVSAFERHGRIILVDAGLGAEPSAYFNGLTGRLPEEFNAAGLDIEAVEHVLFTHFHLDHVGWATHLNGEAFFPNARYHAPAGEIAHWRALDDKAALPHHVEAFRRHVAPLLHSNHLEATEAGDEISDISGLGITYRSVPGHTAGHCAVVITGGDETVLISGDTWHSPAQITVSDWCHRADYDPVRARESRRLLAGWAYDCQAIVAAGHFPEEIAFGRVHRGEPGGFTFAPMSA